MESPPGFEAQVDFGTGAVVIGPDGKRRRTHVIRVVLSHSRRGYSEAVFTQSTDDFIQCLENAFEHFGGVPHTLVIDNLKAGVLQADWFDPRINPKFEEFCRRWTRANSAVTRVGSWWGPSLNSLRRSGTRSSEEIDIVGVARGRVAVVGEARWRNTKMDVDYLADIEQFKLPALRQSGLAVAKSPSIMLFSKGGYTDRLAATAAKRDDIVLVDVGRALLQS